MSSSRAEDKLEKKLAEAILDYARARAAVATIVELSGLHSEPLKLKEVAQEKLRQLPAIEGDFYRVRRQLRRALRSGELTLEYATAQITAWHERSLELKETSARVLRLLPVFKGDYTATQTNGAPPAARPTQSARLLSEVTPLPAVVALDNSNRCNLRCVTCPQAHNQKFAPFDLAWFDGGQFETALTSAEVVHAAGSGEPLLSQTSWRMLTMAARAGAHVSMTTNASLLNRVPIPEDIRDRITIGVSFDGGTPETVEMIRRGFDWHRVVSNLRDLPESTRKRVTLAMTVVRHNHHELPELAAVADDLGIEVIHLQQFSAWTPAVMEMRLTREEWDRLQRDRSNVGVTYPNLTIRDFTHPPAQAPERELDFDASFAALAKIRPQSFEGTDFEPALAAFEASTPSVLALDFTVEEATAPVVIDDGDVVTIPHCTAAWTFANIWSGGSVLPCCSNMPPMGSLRDQSFAEIWMGEAYRELRESLLGQDDLPTQCVRCTDSSRFTCLIEIVQAIIAERPLVKFRVLFDPQELPEHLRTAWNEIGATDRTLPSAATGRSVTSAN